MAVPSGLTTKHYLEDTMSTLSKPTPIDGYYVFIGCLSWLSSICREYVLRSSGIIMSRHGVLTDYSILEENFASRLDLQERG